MLKYSGRVAMTIRFRQLSLNGITLRPLSQRRQPRKGRGDLDAGAVMTIIGCGPNWLFCTQPNP